MLCTILGIHLVLCVQLTLLHFEVLPCSILVNSTFWTDHTLQLAFQWTVYVIFLCLFHLGEFFTTAVFNPCVATGDSFMVNHSKAYTTAALVRALYQRSSLFYSYSLTNSLRQISWTEFCIRILFFPRINNTRVFVIGLCFVIGGQTCRTWAMVTCGESFNHYIQRDKKDNHILVTHGM